MKFKTEFAIYFVVLALFSAVTAFTLLESRRRIADSFYINMAENAQGMATVLARCAFLTDRDYKELKECTFLEAMDHPATRLLIERTKDLGKICNIRYVYVFAPLSDSEIKYHVDSTNASFYDAKPGTPLNLVWLLDVLCDKNDLKKVDTPEKRKKYYSDINRYSFIRQNLKVVIENRKSSYEHSVDEWGDLITGYAPIYTVEGTFVGMLGVDISIDSYVKIWHTSFTKLLVAYAMSFTMFLFLMLIIYRKFRITDRNAKYTDSLTGAFNRRYQDDNLSWILARPPFSQSKFISFIMIDMDHLKDINDTYGHAYGDKVIKKLYSCLSEVMEGTESVIIRWGGDEFISVTGTEREEELDSLLCSLCGKIKENGIEKKGHVSVSIGCRTVPREKLNLSDIERYIRAADEALYESKNNGRDRFTVTSE